jgi:predicted nuclease with TOPRIM domain
MTKEEIYNAEIAAVDGLREEARAARPNDTPQETVQDRIKRTRQEQRELQEQIDDISGKIAVLEKRVGNSRIFGPALTPDALKDISVELMKLTSERNSVIVARDAKKYEWQVQRFNAEVRQMNKGY